MSQEYTYQVKGINSDTDTCECCGKTGLSKVVWIVEIDENGNETGDPVAYGITCAAHKIGFNGTKSQSEKRVIEAQSEYKAQVRENYFNTKCIQVPSQHGEVFIDRQYKIGQVMRDNGFDRNQAINWVRQQMSTQWFMK